MALFEEVTSIEEVTVDALVGEGKKFKTVDDLAKGKAESDRVIMAREQELAELREELKKRETVEDIIQRVTRPPVQSPLPVTESQPTPATSGITDEDLVQRIREVTSEATRAEKVARHAEEVATRLVEVFGSEEAANRAITAKAQELGVSVEFLQSTAVQSPKAFYAQIGLDAVPTSPQSTPRTNGSIVPEALGNNHQGPKPGTYSYYQEILRTKGSTAYFDPRVQNQLMKDAFAASKNGIDFYKT